MWIVLDMYEKEYEMNNDERQEELRDGHDAGGSGGSADRDNDLLNNLPPNVTVAGVSGQGGQGRSGGNGNGNGNGNGGGSVNVARSENHPVREELGPAPRSRSMPSHGTTMLELPSRGVLYGNKLPGGTVEVLPITVSVEKSIAGSRGSFANLLDVMISKCVVTDVLSPDEWLVNDAFYLMLMLRAYSYGSEYQVSLQCDSCRGTTNKVLHIPDDFDVTYLDSDAVEPFYEDLPVSDVRVGFRLLRRSDEREIAKFVRRKESRGYVESGVDEGYVQRIARCIVSLNGEGVEIGSELCDWVENLHARDSLALRDAIEDAGPGVDTSFWYECVRCGVENEETMPFGPQFFRPPSEGRRRRRR